MNADSVALNAEALRAQLMARDPMKRAIALHALETRVQGGAVPAALAGEASRFAARGIPYYSPDDAHYQSWVSKAVHYWERLHT